MPGEKLTVAIAGATGNLGKPLTLALSKEPSIKLKILQRPESQHPITLPSSSCELIQVDLKDPVALAGVLQGVHTVISTMGGSAEAYIESQLSLLHAAVEAGAKRFVPATFGTSNWILEEGDLIYHDIQIPVDRELRRLEAEGRIKTLQFANGYFTEMVFEHLLCDLDTPSPKLEFWGTGTEPFHVTSIADVAHFAARVISSNPDHAGWFNLGIQEVSYQKLADIYEELRGIKVQRVRKGSLEELRGRIEEAKEAFALDQSLYFGLATLQLADLIPKGVFWSPRDPNDVLGGDYQFQSFKEVYAGKFK